MTRIGNFQVMNSREVKILAQQLMEQFGVEEKLPYVFLRNSKDKINIINRDIEKIDYNNLRVDAIGLYIGTIQPDGFRPSIEGAQIIGRHATKNIVELSTAQKHEWMKGNNIELQGEPDRIVLLKSGTDILGSAKIKKEQVLNTVPKARRLSVVNEHTKD